MSNNQMNDNLINDLLDQNGRLSQWLERERQVYLAHNGRDGTLAGFQDHVRKMIEANPALIEMARWLRYS